MPRFCHELVLPQLIKPGGGGIRTRGIIQNQLDSIAIGAISNPSVSAKKAWSKIRSLRSRRVASGSEVNPLAVLAEHAEDLDRAAAGCSEPVRVLRVELRRLAGTHHDVMLAEHQSEPTFQNIDPFITVMRAQDGRPFGGGDDDLERLRFAARLGKTGEGTPFGACCLLRNPRVIDPRGADDVVQRDREGGDHGQQQLETRFALTGLESRERALRDSGRLCEVLQRHVLLLSRLAQSGRDLVEFGLDAPRRAHLPMQAPCSSFGNETPCFGFPGVILVS